MCRKPRLSDPVRALGGSEMFDWREVGGLLLWFAIMCYVSYSFIWGKGAESSFEYESKLKKVLRLKTGARDWESHRSRARGIGVFLLVLGIVGLCLHLYRWSVFP